MSEYKILNQNQRDAFYLPHYRGWELLTGATLAIAPFTFRRGLLAEALAAGGMAAILLAVVFYNSGTAFPGVSALLPCAGAALLIATGEASTRVSQLLSLRPVRFVGVISYSLYLIHWPLFSFAHLYMNGSLAMTQRLGLVLVSVLLAHLSWRYVETPFRIAKLPNKLVILRAAPVLASLYSIGALFQFTGGLPIRVDERVLAIESLRRWDYSKYCRNIEIPGIRDGSTCDFGDTSRSGFDFILWGDSHANHYVPAVDTLAKSQKLHGLLINRASCPPFFNSAGTYKECRRLNGSVMAWLQKQSLRFVLLAGYWTHYNKEVQIDLAASDEETADGLSKTLTELDKRKVAAVILDQVPDFEQNVRLCAARELMHGRSYEWCLKQPEAVFLAHHKFVEEYFQHLRQRHVFSIATPLRALCDGEFCRAAVNGEIIIRDRHHLTPAGALHVMPYLDIPGLSPGLLASGTLAAPRNGEIVRPFSSGLGVTR